MKTPLAIDQSANLQICPKSSCQAVEWCELAATLTECGAQISGLTPALVRVCCIHLARVQAVTDLCGLT